MQNVDPMKLLVTTEGCVYLYARAAAMGRALPPRVPRRHDATALTVSAATGDAFAARVRDRVIPLLESRRGERLCLSCIAGLLQVTDKQAHEATLKLEQHPAFRRQCALCSMCGKTRTITTHASPPFGA